MEKRNLLSSQLKNAGVTLIELLVTLAVLGIVLAIAVPSFQAFAIQSRLAVLNNDLMTALAYAKSEAIKRGVTVSVCSSSTGNSCTGTWSQGWIVYVNPTTATPLRVAPALPANYTINSGSGLGSFVSFDRAGAAQASGVFVVCNNSDETTARGMVLTRLRIRLATDTDGDGIINTDIGNIGSCESP